jgi:hypothetical protein
MEALPNEYPVSVLCETLGVSLSGYSGWKNRAMSQHQREEQQLAAHIHAVYHACRQVSGSPRIPGSNCAIKVFPARANAWHASCASVDSLHVADIIGQSRHAVSLEHVLHPMCWIRRLPQLVRMRSGRRMCARKARFVVFPGELRVERSRMTNELTGGGNPIWDQSMLVKRQS